MREPLVVAIDMGYGHMRPARVLGERAGTVVHAADSPELAGEDERRLWARIRTAYESATRWSSRGLSGAPFRLLVDHFTGIDPLHPHRDQSRPDFAVRRFAAKLRAGLGRRLAEVQRESGRPLVATHFAPALAAEAHGCEDVHCVVTDTDVHRIWAPLEPQRTRICYLVPAQRTLRRLRAYGVPRANVEVTGYPLPHSLLGGEELSVLARNLAARLVRLDPRRSFREASAGELRAFLGSLPEEEEGRPPHITFAVGGAGAQTALVARALPSLRSALAEDRMRLTLVAGVRPEVAARFERLVREHGLERRVEILRADTLDEYFRRFDELLARTDVLWTKPSELTFFGALGLALVLSPPVGVHEGYNRRWAREHGAALKQRDARYAGQWLVEALEDGLLAAAAWSGYLRLPKFGLYRILRAIEAGQGDARNTRRQSGNEKLA